MFSTNADVIEGCGWADWDFGHGAAAVVIAAAGTADGELIRFDCGTVAGMHCLAETAGMRRRSGGRQRERDTASG